MASTTTAKKEIIDFLWEWANAHNDWGKLLIDTIVKTENSLNPQDRQLVFNYFLDSLRSTKQLQPLTFIKPKYTPSSKVIELISLKDITGVNRLAKNQSITFGKNITIIYGENGTGKTGYGRILKSLGFSYDNKNIIHHNVYGDPEPKTATIDFSTNANPITFNWNGSNNHPELTNISVFNSNCVQLSLNDRQLIVSPIGFHLFNIVTSELSELATLLRQKIAAHPTTLSWTESLNVGSTQHQFISTLNAKSTEQRLDELSTYLPAQDKELQQKELDLGNLNHELLRIQINNLSAQINELSSIIAKIKIAQSVFSESQIRTLIDLNKRINALEGKTKSGLKEVAEANGIEFYERKEFKDFITAADSYLKILDKPNYPELDDKCIYCNQPLEISAKELLANYKRLLTDTTQEDLQKLNIERELLIGTIKKIDTNLYFNHPIFGIDENEQNIQPQEIIKYNEELTRIKTSFEANSITEDSKFDFDYVPYVTFLEDKKINLQKGLTDKTTTLSGITTKAATLKSEINELKDRKTLSTKAEEVKTVIKNIKIALLLNSKVSEFSTNSVSRKTTEAREELVQQNFDTIFKNELKAFRKSHITLELNFGTDRGNSKVTQRIKSYSLTDILSEGEQKAIALAEFLTELQLDNIIAPVIFDDPVNSLDHRIIDEVAKRLIELSKGRQTIVFTHSILLLNSFIQQSELDSNKQAGVNFSFYSVRNNFEETGIVDEVEEINSYTYYKKKLEAIINAPKNGKVESQLAAEGYGHLRSAIEITVEEDILQKTIKRYRKGVAFPSLLRIEGHKIDAHKGNLNDIYEKCCVSIAGHSSPSELLTTPTVNELKADYESFKQLRKNFI
ncbi:AAA family ATPase [Flavitalea flava]